MESTPGTSTSTAAGTLKKNTRCSPCNKIFHMKDILRLIIFKHLSIIIAHIYTEDGDVKIISKSVVHFHRIYQTQLELVKMFYRSSSPNARPVNKDHDEMYPIFLHRFSEYMNIDISIIKRSVQNLFCSTTELFIDFDLQTLIVASRQCKQAIEDIIVKIFWSPFPLTNKKFESHSWFEFVDRGLVVPFFMTCDKQRDIVIDENLHCLHELEKSCKKIMSFHVLDANAFQNQDSYSKFLKSGKRKLPKRTSVTFEEDDTSIGKHNITHVFRYFSNKDYSLEQNCLFENQETIKLLRNTFVQYKIALPFIAQVYNPGISKYVFHIVYKDDVNPTPENFYQLLVLLRDVLITLEIDSVTLKCCKSYNISKVLDIIQYVLCDHGIAVTIVGYRKSITGCMKKLALFKRN